MHEVSTEIEIDAAAGRLWDVLTDFRGYPEWNPFIRSIDGVPRPGTRLQVHLQAGGTRGMVFRPLVLVATPGAELRWRGRLLVPGVFDGEHRFVIRALDDGRVAFEQGERFTGMLVPLYRRSLDRDIRRGFEEMNAALKERAETQQGKG